MTLKTASRVEEWLDALRLVYDCYVQAGLALPNCHRLRVTPYQLLPKSEVLVGMVADKILCTVTLVPDSEQGLPMEALYDREVAIRRDRGARLAEVSCLADRPDEDRSSFSVLQRLMSFTAQCALRRGVDELLIAVHPATPVSTGVSSPSKSSVERKRTPWSAIVRPWPSPWTSSTSPSIIRTSTSGFSGPRSPTPCSRTTPCPSGFSRGWR